MEMPKITSIRPFLFIGLVLSLIGWGGLAYVIMDTLPTLGPRWLFFFFLVMGMSGTSMPIIGFLHLRFPGDPPSAPGVVVRQAIWVGIYGGLLAWLQLGRVLDTARAVFLAVGFILIEILLHLRERSQFKPTDNDGE
jgi:hypothetical protein